MLYNFSKKLDDSSPWDEHLDITFEIKEVSEDGTFSGYASTFGNVDSDRDIIEQGAFTKVLSKKKIKDIKMLWYHNPKEVIGVWTEIIQDKKGLLVKGRLLLDIQQAKDTYIRMKAGAIDTMSIGFAIYPDGYTIDENKRARRINAVDLWEISVVTFPANDKAKIRRVKSATYFNDICVADHGRPWNAKEAEARVRQWAGGAASLDAIDWWKYKQAFLWFDGDDQENTEKYKFQIADVIKGELHVIPKAVFQIAGELLSKSDVPENSENRIISHLEQYYSKMDMESPFPVMDMADVVKSYNTARLSVCKNAKEYESTLCEAGFSCSEAKAITAKIGPQREVEDVTSALKKANEILSTLKRVAK